MRLLLSLFYIAFLFASEATAQTTDVSNTPRSHVILLPGLNHSGAHLKDLKKIFSDRGLPVTIVHLTGQRNRESCNQKLKDLAAAWKRDVDSTLAKIEEPEVIIVGYSLGALLALETAQRSSNVSSLILFAPPVKLRWKPGLIRVLLPFRFFNLSLPSFAPHDSRVCPRTPLQSYSGASDLLKQIERSNIPQNDLPLLIFADKEDEIVSLSGIKKWFPAHSYLQATILEVTSSESETSTLPAHLLVDPKRVGASEWSRIESKIADFIESN